MSTPAAMLPTVTISAPRLPSAVPVSSTASGAQSGITFTLSTAVGSPNPIVFGDQTSPLAVSELEIPARLASLGGVQRNAIHYFPGGYKTIQALGAFPHTLRWRGILLGGNAFPRSFQLDTMRRSGNTAYLTAGPWMWEGLVTSYLADVLHQNYISYEMEFEPTVDLTSTRPQSNVGSGPSMTQLLQQINSQYLASTSLLSLASQTALQAFSNTVSSFVTQGANGGSLSTSQLASIFKTQASVDTALNLDALSTNAQTAAEALGAQSAVSALVGGLSTTPVGTSVTLVNPNLVMVAAQYLGDGSRWQEIANLNGLGDIEPVGTYTLQIPSD